MNKMNILSYIVSRFLYVGHFMAIPLKWSFIFLIRSYQILISPILPPSCRFVPSCSQYFLDALKTRGLIVGMILGIYRILRCHPFCKGGYDPVPQPDKRKEI